MRLTCFCTKSFWRPMLRTCHWVFGPRARRTLQALQTGRYSHLLLPGFSGQPYFDETATKLPVSASLQPQVVGHKVRSLPQIPA